MTGARARWADGERAVEGMTNALVHRGPDGRGSARCVMPGGTEHAVAVFGHTRLAIIDLSTRAAQPMTNADRSVWLTYNGEVFNYRLLREELRRAGATFVSESDTEVILRGFEHWGEAVIDRLDGMFALALWDARAGRLLLARDRLGIKPLYVYREPGLVAFASEVRALLDSGLVPRQLDPEGLGDYLMYQTTVTPRTLVRRVSMLPAATAARFSATAEAQRTYWNLVPPQEDRASASRPEAVARVAELLEAAVGSHLVSDVPVGVFLSSGLDSSAIASLVRRTGQTPHTFTLSVPGLTGDEGPAARRIAEALGAEHHEVVLASDEVRRAVVDGLHAFDHPSGDGLNAFVIARAVRAAGLTVALSGLGGDELFGGYASFRRLRALARVAPFWRRVPASLRQGSAGLCRRVLPRSIQTDKACDILATDCSVGLAYPILRQIFSARARRPLLSTAVAEALDESGDSYAAAFSRTPGFATADTLTQVSCAEALTYMHDVLLRDTDQMSMRHGLEVRVPLLDHRLVHAVMALPQSIKGPAPTPKALLADAVGPILPREVPSGPKQGFVLPFDSWMRGDLRALSAHHLGEDGLAGRRFMRREGVTAVWEDFLAGRSSTSWSRPWALVALNAWLEATRADL